MDAPVDILSGTGPAAALAHAAECLAKAAITLSEAARAMSVAAEAMSSQVSTSLPQNDVTTRTNTADTPIISYESDTESSVTEGNTGNSGETPGVRENTLTPRGDSGNEEDTNPGGIDHSVPNDHPNRLKTSSIDEAVEDAQKRNDPQSPSADPLSIDPLRSDTNRPPPASTAENETAIESNPAYCIMLDNEGDVLLFVCALVTKYRKVVCYMHCSVRSLDLYKRLISGVTEMPAYTIGKTTPTELEHVGKEFLKEDRSILLLPESVCPSIVLGDIETCVIHIGWPFSEKNCVAQRKAHQANKNILIAYAEDENLYPAGSAIMRQSKPWPEEMVSLKISAEVLRPLYDQKLAEIPTQMKGRVYPEWINFHGACGPRYVRSWTPSMLVYRANLYLLDVLRYDTGNTETRNLESTLHIPLPQVSTGFVVSNGLESAVEEGVLRVKSSDSGLNHISSLSRGDLVPPGITPLNERGTPMVSNRQDGVDTGNPSDLVPKSPTPMPPKPDIAASNVTRKNEFQPTPGHTYFALDEEFDAIPLMCFLALTSASDKAIFFLDDQSILAHYQKLINRITGRLVIVPQTNDEDQSQANRDAAVSFKACVSPVILLLPYRTPKFPAALERSTIGCCIYWGAGDFIPFGQARKHRTRLNCPATSIIMTTAQRDSSRKELKAPSNSIKEHPSSPDLVDLSADSWLSPMRTTTKSILNDNRQIARNIYGAHLYFLAKVPRSVLSAEEVARQVNRYSARVLLRGNEEDGSKKFPPVAGRFSSSAKTIKSFDLEPAVDAGLLMVGEK